MSWVPVAEYFMAVGVYGFLYWLGNGIVEELLAYSLTGNAYTFMLMLWHGSPLFVMFMAGIWLLTVMQKRERPVE
jgi:hypothetical protein